MVRALVQHEVEYKTDRDGMASVVGTHRSKGGHEVKEITFFYSHMEDGCAVCRVSSGDTFKVKPVGHRDYEYITTG